MSKAIKGVFGTLLAIGVAGGAGYFGFNAMQNSTFAKTQEQVQLSREQLAKIDDLSTVFRYVGKVVEPSVVNINITKMQTGNSRQMPMDKDQLRRFFPDRDGDGEPDLPPGFDGDLGSNELHGTGSGVIMEVENGSAYVLTNNHVAGDATMVEVNLTDGRKITNGRVIGADKKTDLAVIKIDADRLIAAKWGNSDDLQKGDWVMAFGSPFGYVGSMTHGIVSALNRQAGILGDQGYENFIQVDAPINPGNSGGPLVNSRGEVIGINTAIASRTGAFSGIGFAIPSNQAKFVYDNLKSNGKVTRGWLGVSISDVARDLAKAQSFGFDGKVGVIVEDIVANTPAMGKLETGDIITAIDGKAVDSVQQLRGQVATMTPDSQIRMSLFRNGKSMEVELKLGTQPENPLLSQRNKPAERSAVASAKTGLGLTLADTTSESARTFGLTDIKKGALVTNVQRNSAAARAGIVPGDVIAMVDRADVATADQARDAIKAMDLKKGVRLYVISREIESGQSVSRFVFVKVLE